MYSMRSIIVIVFILVVVTGIHEIIDRVRAVPTPVIIAGLNDYSVPRPVDPGVPVQLLPECDVVCQYYQIPAPIRWTIRIVFNLWDLGQ
jgi:CxxC motif-containing protein